MAEEQLKTSLIVETSVQGGEASAAAIKRLRDELAKLKREAPALTNLANTMGRALSEDGIVRQSRATAAGLKTVKDQAEALKPAIQGIRDAVKATGLPEDYLKKVGLDKKSLTDGGKNLKAFDELLGKFQAAHLDAVQRASARVAAVETKTQEIKSRIAREAADQQAVRALRERVQTAETARQKISEAKKSATSVERIQADSARKLDLTARRVRPAGQLDEAAKQAQAQRIAAQESEYQALKKSIDQRRSLLQRLAGDMKQVGSSWSRGFDQLGPSTAQLRAARLPAAPEIPSIRPQALLGAGPILGGPSSRARRPAGPEVYTGPTERAAQALQKEVGAANSAAAAMANLAAQKKNVAQGEKMVATATGNLIQQLMKEMKAAPAAGAALHKMMRQTEAMFNKAYGQRMAGTYNTMGGAIRNVTGAVRANGDALLGQVKQVAVLATTFSVLQGVAGRLQEGFHHLTGGIIGFNQMLERTTVGFRVLFENQAKQVAALRAMGDESKQIDYITMGYTNAGKAAEGMVETIRQFANVTPFRFEELAETTLRMKAFGFGMDEILYKSEDAAGGFSGAVVAIGDAVAALGGGAERFRRITYALGQMKQAGRVYQNDMMQLANAGIGGYQYIANSLRKEITEGNTGRKEDVKSGYADLYDELSKNTIETVRRLTTNGQISGEAAARAIIDGLKTDFGGGMNEFSKTFVGAWTTLADTSQSLVATAFEPFYNELRDVLYDLSQFFQTPEADELAKSFQPTIKKLTNQIFGFVKTAGEIFMLFVDDVTNAFNQAKEKAGRFGVDFKAVFDSLRDGIGVVVDLLRNDLTRGIIGTSIAFTTLFQFAAQNPMLTMILGVIAGLGLLKNAYDENIAGFRGVVDGLSQNFLGLVKVIQENLVPAVTEFSAALGSVLFVTALEVFGALAKVLEVFAAALATILTILRPLAPLLGIIIGGLAVKLGFGLALTGINRLIERIQKAMLSMKQMGDQAVLASGKINRFLGGPGSSAKGGKGGKGGSGIGIGNASMAAFGLGIAADMAGAPEIGGLLTDLSMVAMGLSAIKSVVSGTVLATSLTRFAGGIATVILPVFGKIAAIIAAIGSGPILLALAGIASLILLVAAFGKGTTAPKPGSTAYNYLTGTRPDETPYSYAARDSGSGQVAPRQKTPAEILAEIKEGGYPARLKAILAINKQITLEQANLKSAQASMNAAAIAQAEDRIRILELERRKIEALAGATRDAWVGSQAFVNFRAMERGDLSSDSFDAIADAIKDAADSTDDAAASYTLLLAKQKEEQANMERRNKLQEKYNRLLQQAQQKLEYGNSLLQELAQGALDNLLNPDIDRINPYTGLAQTGLEIEEILKISERMQFTQFENIQGTTRSFEEYRDILTSIKPLTEKDVYNGKISLQAVTERLKIDKERKAQLELIKKIQQTEYDLQMEALRQYDESIDPLERAINLRKAQMSYEQGIRDVRMEGLDLVVNEADASQQMVNAEVRIAKKLKDIQRGQELILQEMARRFEDYNQEVADIMANPDFSLDERKKLLQEALNSLTQDLEDNFGITEAQLQSQYDRINAQMDLARQATAVNFGEFMKQLANPTIPPITWGGKLKDMFTSGVFAPLMSYLNGEYARIAALIEKIKKLAASGGGGGGGGGTGDDDTGDDGTTLEEVIANRTGNLSSRLADTPAEFYKRFAGDSSAEKNDSMQRWINSMEAAISNISNATTIKSARAMANRISSALGAKGLARGGIAGGGSMHLVGEAGPELFIPQKSGLVLNNTVSSRLLGMLSGSGSGAGANVIININNPTVRNDADIRKLTEQITKAQVSMYRSQGGRLI